MHNRPRGHRRAPERGDKAKRAAKQVPKKFPVFTPPSKPPESGHDASSSERDSRESEKGEVLSLFAQAGVQVPRPSGRAERQGTHSSTPGSDECKRAAHESARDSPSLECRGLRQRLKGDRSRSLFSPDRVRRASARESPCPTPVVGRHRVAAGSGVTLPLREGRRRREASRGAKQRDLTAPPATRRVSDTCTTRVRACVTDVQYKYTAQAAHAHVQPHDTPTRFHSFIHTFIHSFSSVTRHARHAHAQVTRETHHTRRTTSRFSQVCLLQWVSRSPAFSRCLRYGYDGATYFLFVFFVYLYFSAALSPKCRVATLVSTETAAKVPLLLTSAKKHPTQFCFSLRLQCDPLNVTVNEIAVCLQFPALSTELTVFTQDHRCCRQALPIPGSVVPATFHR